MRERENWECVSQFWSDGENEKVRWVRGDREKKRGRERKNTKILYANATIIVHICTVTIAIVH